jgi:V/A-type H+-transporting ATPase subunit E
MAEELQSLLERIQAEGVKKADEQKEQILSEAKEQAKEIIEKAKTEADSIIKSAEENAQKSEARAKSAIQQAARDIILALKSDLDERLNAVTKECVGTAMTPEQMKKYLDQMVEAYKSKGGNVEAGIEVLVSANDLDAIAQQLKSSVLSSLKTDPTINISSDFSTGLQIGFKDEQVFLDLSDEALTDLICVYVGPKLASLIKS